MKCFSREPLAQSHHGEDRSFSYGGNLSPRKKAGQVSLHVNAHPTKKDKRTRNPKQTAWSYGLRLGAISADHGDRMCAGRGQVIVLTGYGEGGAAVLGHHANGTSQGLQVFRG